MDTKKNKKVIVIGLDGATPELLFKWAKEGKLPNISKIMSGGSWGNLKSTYPPQSSAAWTTFFTGTNPGKHGIYHFLRRVPDSYDYAFNNSKDNSATPIWKIVNNNNKKVGIMQIPLIYPPVEVDGFMVTGLTTPGEASEYTYPKELKKTLKDRGFRLHNSVPYKENNEKEYLEDLYDTEKRKVAATKFLLKNYDSDLFIVVFSGSDQMQHYFWKYMDDKHPGHDPARHMQYKDEILHYYQTADGWVGDILNDIGEDVTVFIMSDHGGGPVYKDVNFNYWFQTLGLQEIKKSRRRKIRHLLIKKGFTMVRLDAILKELGLLDFARKNVPEIIKKKLLPRGDALSEIDWSKTKAFSFGNLGLVYLNVKGRDPQGIVSPGEEYEKLRTFLIEEFLKLKDPENGTPIVENAFRKEEIYSGPELKNAPDIFVATNMIYREYMRFSNSLVQPLNDVKNVEQRLRVSGQHRQHGIFIARGTNIKKNQFIENAEIVDLASNILYCMGLPIPTDMDGKILSQMFDENYMKENPVLYEEVSVEKEAKYEFSADDEEKVRKSLKSLGYLD
ncbi:Type I phosphodiesterase / nucleotide pyrophosphatase [uncultured archaeon]|nr:Type I phosphodiesterase / nucleotide pyrophosphatase [uncultured archaeon]